MKISNNSQSISQVYAQLAAETSGQAVVSPIEGSAPRPSQAKPLPDAEKKNDSKVRGENGVLRLLEEGHFKPHTEMRLLEIFHRDLALLQAKDPPSEPPVIGTPLEESAILPEQELVAEKRHIFRHSNPLYRTPLSSLKGGSYSAPIGAVLL